MASTLTRSSSRRTEGLSTRSRNTAIFPGNNTMNRKQPPNVGRKKRPLEDEEEDAMAKKRQKLQPAVEIKSRPTKKAVRSRSVVSREADAKLVQAPELEIYHNLQAVTQSATQKPATLPELTEKPTKHHDKVVNGIRHELDRLQPVGGDGLNTGELLRQGKRKLRSQAATKFKSELSAYFPEYDEVIGNEPKEKHILNVETRMVILDSDKATSKQPPKSYENYLLKEYHDALYTELNDSQRVDFSFLDRNYKDDEDGDDPLTDEYLESIHKKPERTEKSYRNNDKGRAQHERDQVIRLLEGLQGPEWLKLMGVSGITDSKRKEYEPARAHFIRGCETIIEKFRIWREEEKKRKLEKDAARRSVTTEVEGGGEEEAEEEEIEVEDADEVASQISDGDPPDYSDVDASAARQLHQEAIARSAPKARGGRKQKDQPPARSPKPNEVETEFKSFFKKPHLREKAIGKSRRSGRIVAAWGHPVPEVDETNFDLPEEYRDDETLKARQRRKRREKRVGQE